MLYKPHLGNEIHNAILIARLFVVVLQDYCKHFAHTVEDKKTFPFDVLQNGTVCIVVRCVLRNGIKTLQKRYALKTVVERLKNGYGTVVLLLWNNLLALCVRGCGYMHSWSWQRDRDVSIR